MRKKPKNMFSQTFNSETVMAFESGQQLHPWIFMQVSKTVFQILTDLERANTNWMPEIFEWPGPSWYCQPLFRSTVPKSSTVVTKKTILHIFKTVKLIGTVTYKNNWSNTRLSVWAIYSLSHLEFSSASWYCNNGSCSYLCIGLVLSLSLIVCLCLSYH